MNELSPFPSGWFVIAFSSELKKGKILSRTFMGQEVVLFRSREGIASALDAYCPHLGAHLGHGGKIVDGCIQCPFHHLKFKPDGQCTNAKHIKAKTWPLEERDGVILLYHGNLDKQHTLLNLSDEGFKPYRKFSRRLKTYPQDVIENFADAHHFIFIHKFNSIKLTSLSSNSEVFSLTYGFSDHCNLFGYKFGKPHEGTIQLRSFGIGYSVITLGVPSVGIEIAFLHSPCPADTQYTDARITLYIKTLQPKSKFFLSLFSYLLLNDTIRAFNQDAPIWEHKRYLTHPMLKPHDISIAAFRKWAKRFYQSM